MCCVLCSIFKLQAIPDLKLPRVVSYCLFMLATVLIFCDLFSVSSLSEMEFRVFLPRLSATESKSSFQHAKYEVIVSSLISSFGELNAASLEKREDIYLVGGCHFGVKVRSGKKLEIKIRRKKLNFNIEHWKKVKLGKKHLDHYKNEILELLQIESDQPQPSDLEMLKAGKFINVAKARTTQLFGEVSKEICFISTQTNSRHWISFAVEGSLEDIQIFLSGNVLLHTDLNYLLEALHIASELAKHDHALLPVVAGYPTWVRVASGSVQGEEFNEVLGSVDSFLASLTFIPSSITEPAIAGCGPDLITRPPSNVHRHNVSEEKPSSCFGLCRSIC